MNGSGKLLGRRERLLAALRHFRADPDEVRTMEGTPKGVGWSTLDDLEEAGLIETVTGSGRGLAAMFRTTDAGCAVLDAEDPNVLLPPYRRKREWPQPGYPDADLPPAADSAHAKPLASRAKRRVGGKPDHSFPPRGLCRSDAAWYVGVGVSKFDEMVRDGRMPAPKNIDSRRVWDRIALDDAFDALPSLEDESNSWDIVR